MVAPVPYIMRLELKGSISRSPTIQPELGRDLGRLRVGAEGQPGRGADVLHVAEGAVRIAAPKSQIRVQVAPPFVLRQIIVSGHQELRAETMSVSGFCASTASPP